jgi:hypothetical protein
VADPLVPVQHGHRQQERAELPRAEEDRRRLRRRRQDYRYAVAARDAVRDEQVRGLVRQVLELAPAELAAFAVVALVNHCELVARVLVADVRGDVVALGHAPLVRVADLLVAVHLSLPR